MTNVAYLPSDTSSELEADLISALAHARPEARNELLQAVHPGDYLTGKHRTLHEVIARLHRSGVNRIDGNVIVDELERRGHIEAAGQAHYVAETLGRIVHNGEDIARRVVERSQRRTVGDRARMLVHEIAESAEPPSTVVHRAVEDLLATARRREGGIVTALDTADRLRELATNGPADGWRSGWSNLDALYRPRPGQLTVLTGIPSHGKSTWLDAYLLRLAQREDGFRAAFFSPERETVKHQMRLISTVARIPEREINAERVEGGIAWLGSRFTWLDDQADATLDSIIARARLVDDRTGISGLVIDPWNWVEAGRPMHVTSTEWIGHCLNQLVRLAQQRELHVWVVAHPTKTRQHEGGEMSGAYHVPKPYDISDSANWFNKPWFCLSIWRDHLAPAMHEPGFNVNRDPAIVEVNVQKVRDDDLGRVGKASFRFREGTREYHPLDERFGMAPL